MSNLKYRDLAGTYNENKCIVGPAADADEAVMAQYRADLQFGIAIMGDNWRVIRTC